MAELNLFEEANRQLVICNACRYCEGYCPVFRAIETRRDFTNGDILYLANLCHDCRACYYACMYTPPHEFAINFPQIMAEVRMSSYERWSWPGILGKAFSRRSVGVLLAAATMLVVLVAALLLIPGENLFGTHTGPGTFYQVVPYPVMVGVGLALFFYAILIWILGGSRFWSEAGGILRQPGGLKAMLDAIAKGLTLGHYDGGGAGCNYPGDEGSSSRRIFHIMTYWGMLSALISTTLAFLYQHFLEWMPPYPLTSAPVIFGTVGGIALMIGTGGLIGIKWNSDPVPEGKGASGMDYTFLVTLFLASLTGMLTLILRSTSAMGSILVIHLASIAALFLTAPYGKFVHAVYRTLAIVRYSAEQSQADAKHAVGH
jgi:citrate/tricarballylate utilization protein